MACSRSGSAPPILAVHSGLWLHRGDCFRTPCLLTAYTGESSGFWDGRMLAHRAHFLFVNRRTPHRAPDCRRLDACIVKGRLMGHTADNTAHARVAATHESIHSTSSEPTYLWCWIDCTAASCVPGYWTVWSHACIRGTCCQPTFRVAAPCTPDSTPPATEPSGHTRTARRTS